MWPAAVSTLYVIVFMQLCTKFPVIWNKSVGRRARKEMCHDCDRL